MSENKDAQYREDFCSAYYFSEELLKYQLHTNTLVVEKYNGYLAGRKKGEEEMGKFALSSYESIQFIKDQCFKKEDAILKESAEIQEEYEKEIIELKKEMEELKSHKQYKVDMITLIRLKEDENQKLRELVERQFKGHRDSEEIEQWHKEAKEVLR